MREKRLPLNEATLGDSQIAGGGRLLNCFK